MRVVVTGATRGIGAGLAEVYRGRGDAVIGTGRNGADVSLDVTDPGDFGSLAESVGDGPLDLLVCNAGVYLDKGERLEEGYAPDMWAETFAVNVTGVFLSVQTLLPALRRTGGAKIAIISSQMASQERAPGGSYIYRASKAAVLNLGRNLAVDLRADGIAVGIYHPGWVRTDMGTSAAEIPVEEAARGLVAKFDALDLSRTGCFRTWDGRNHPF